MTELTLGGFFARRWRGNVPLSLLLWRDMLGVGSLVNMACTVLALVMAARGTALGIATACISPRCPTTRSSSLRCGTRRSAMPSRTSWPRSG